LRSAGKKLIAVLLLGGIAIGAFATLGDGKSGKGPRKLLSNKTTTRPGSFSLHSGYQFRGNQVMTFNGTQYINFNTTVTYQQGHTTYIVPFKKKVILNNKIVFNPNSATR
jgi:hypothetical protein